MNSIVVSAKYKGKPSDFFHGESYMLSVASGLSHLPIVVYKLESVGDQYRVVPGATSYESVVAFLTDWEEITSYPSFETLEAQLLGGQN